jgi:tetratricopeptide (TPR) repeat protein
MKTLLALLSVSWLLAGNLFAASVDDDFAAANKLYAEGKFAAAAKAYDQLCQSGVRSTALLFNDADAHFKAGHLGRAIAAYRQAALFSPRNAEINANLEFVRKQVQGPTLHESHWTGSLNMLSLNEWTVLTVIGFWVTFLLLGLRQLRPALAGSLKNLTLFFALLTIASGSVLGVRAAGHLSNGTAVVLSAEATARSGPWDEAQSVFTVHDGAELSIASRHEDWVQVTDGAGKIGWLPNRLVAILPGA